MATPHDSDSDSELIFEDAVEVILGPEENTNDAVTETDQNKNPSTCPVFINPQEQGNAGESMTPGTQTPISPELTDNLSERLATVKLEGSNLEKDSQKDSGDGTGHENGDTGTDDEETQSCSDSDGEFDEETVDEFLKGAMQEKESPAHEESEEENEEGQEGMKIDEESLKERDATLTEEEKEELKEKAQNSKSEGNRVFKEGNYTASILEYTTALRTCPLCFSKERSIMYSNRGAAKLHLEKYEAAIEDCTHAVELNPAYLKALMRRAELYEKTDKLDEALADHTKVLEMDPSQHSAREACMRLPEQITIRNEKMKEEMMGKLKDLGNMILKPFGLSTNNFQLQQDPKTGGYSVNFQQNQARQPPPQ